MHCSLILGMQKVYWLERMFEKQGVSKLWWKRVKEDIIKDVGKDMKSELELG